MQVSILNDDGSTATVRLQGKLDLLGVDSAAAPLATLAATKSELLIDMAGVTFITSPGIRQLVSASKVLTSHGGRLVLLTPNETVIEVLTAAGVSDLMTIVCNSSEVAGAPKSSTQ